MTLRTPLIALGIALGLAFAFATPGWAAETPGKRGPGGIPKGTYTQSCACQFSGGVELACFCSNLHAKWFRTVLDVRNCQLPKDIKNCEGVLTCTENAGAQCPAKDLGPAPAPAAVKPAAAKK